MPVSYTHLDVYKRQIVNIAKKGNVEKITPIDIENEISQFDTAISLWKNNDGWGYIESAIELSLIHI